jgi:phosphatidylserine/phosphatidylglycerophosphate/cardiolipin synthase-like enzyme
MAGVIGSLPLEPDLQPWPIWLKRLTLILALALALLVLGIFSGTARRPPPQLLRAGAGHGMEYPRAVERLIAGARERVTLVVFVMRMDEGGPVDQLMQVLVDAARRGVAVRVALDRGRDWQTGEPDAKHEAAAAWLRERGVTVVLDDLETTTHAKALVVDGRQVVMGSHNWTRSAFTTNRECSLLLDDACLAADLEHWFAAIPGWDGTGNAASR